MVDTILSSLDDDNGQDVLAIDLVGKTSIADRMIVASGTSGRMVSAMAEHLVVKLKGMGMKPKTEGEKYGDWVLIDAGDVIVHLFRPEVRAFYNIERIWAAPANAQPSAPGKTPAKTGLKTGLKAGVKAVAKKAVAKKAPEKKAVAKKAVAKKKVVKRTVKSGAKPVRAAARRA